MSAQYLFKACACLQRLHLLLHGYCTLAVCDALLHVQCVQHQHVSALQDTLESWKQTRKVLPTTVLQPLLTWK